MTVLVAGAGPVGLMAALLLARHGVPSVVLEKRAAREPAGSRSICVQGDVLDIYARVGVADRLVAEGVYWRLARTFYRGRELFRTAFPEPPAGGFPPWINLGQDRVEHHLEAACAAEPKIQLRYGHRVTALRQDASSVTVECGSASVTGTHLIAADGARSAVRELLGVGFPGRSYGDRFLIADIRAGLPFGVERQFHFDPDWNPGRQVLVHPQPGSVWRIDWQVPADFDPATGGVDTLVRRITGDRPYTLEWLSLYQFQQRLADRFRVGRVLLAGDAAHLMAPFGARGLNSGVQDAENAAWKVALDARGEAGPVLLDSYDTERRAAAAENLRVTGATMRFLVPQSEAEWEHRRRTLDRAVTDPAARQDVDSGKLAEPFRYRDSPLTTPGCDGALSPGKPPGVGFTLLHSARYREKVVVVRPDGHVAAVLERPAAAEIDAALRRARGFTPGAPR